MIAEIIPEGIDALVRIQCAYRIGPPLLQQALVCLAAFRLEQRVAAPGLRIVDVEVRGHDVEVAREHDRAALPQQCTGVTIQPLEPRELVVELRPRLGIAVRQVQRGDDDAADLRLDVTALGIAARPRQPAAPLDRLGALREDRDAVPGTFAVPDGAVAGRLDRRSREASFHGLEFLETGDVGRLVPQPSQEISEATVHAVDIEGRDPEAHAMSTISASLSRSVTTSRIPLPMSSRASGDTYEIFPSAGSASSSPTMR